MPMSSALYALLVFLWNENDPLTLSFVSLHWIVQPAAAILSSHNWLYKPLLTSMAVPVSSASYNHFRFSSWYISSFSQIHCPPHSCSSPHTVVACTGSTYVDLGDSACLSLIIPLCWVEMAHHWSWGGMLFFIAPLLYILPLRVCLPCSAGAYSSTYPPCVWYTVFVTAP